MLAHFESISFVKIMDLNRIILHAAGPHSKPYKLCLFPAFVYQFNDVSSSHEYLETSQNTDQDAYPADDHLNGLQFRATDKEATGGGTYPE